MSKTKTDADYLREAKALIANPEHWCQGYVALDADGKPCSVKIGGPAVKRCAFGAVWTLCDFHSSGEEDFLDDAARQMGVDGHFPGIDLNNTRKHADVMKMFDLAIELAESGT